jgi:hypothetical protein
MRVRVCIALAFYHAIRMVRANPRGFSSVQAAAWGLTGGSPPPPANVQGGHEHDHDCVVPRAAGLERLGLLAVADTVTFAASARALPSPSRSGTVWGQ